MIIFLRKISKGVDWFTVDDYSYRGCVNDIEKAMPYMNEGGIIIIDDYMSGPPNGQYTRSNKSVWWYVWKYETKLEEQYGIIKEKGFVYLRFVPNNRYTRLKHIIIKWIICLINYKGTFF